MKQCKWCGASVEKRERLQLPTGKWYWGCEACVAAKSTAISKAARKRGAEKRKAIAIEKAQLSGGPMYGRAAEAALNGRFATPSEWNHLMLVRLLDMPEKYWEMGLEASDDPDYLTKCRLVVMNDFDVMEWASRHVDERRFDLALCQLLPESERAAYIRGLIVTTPIPAGVVTYSGGNTGTTKKDRCKPKAQQRSPYKRGFAPKDINSPRICDISLETFFEKAIAPRLQAVCRPVIHAHLNTYGLVSPRVDAAEGLGPYEDPNVDEVLQLVRIRAWEQVERVWQTARAAETTLIAYLKRMAANMVDSWLRAEGVVPRFTLRDGCKRRTVNGKRICYSFRTCTCARCKQEGTCWIRKEPAEWQKYPLSLNDGSDSTQTLSDSLVEPDRRAGPSEPFESLMDDLRSIANFDLLLAFYNDIPDSQLAAERGCTEAAIRKARNRAMTKARTIAERFRAATLERAA